MNRTVENTVRPETVDEHLTTDVVVVGGGNAGLCAAAAVIQRGASVILIEKAPRDKRGGNTQFTRSYRFAYDSVDDLARLSTDVVALGDRLVAPPYPVSTLLADIRGNARGLDDPEMSQVIAAESFDTMLWLKSLGVRWSVARERAKEVDGKLVWEPGMVLVPEGGGPELVRALFAFVEESPATVLFGTAARGIIQDERGRVTGVVAIAHDEAGARSVRIDAASVVMAAGGFESDPNRRARYLGPGWDTVKLRGSRYNTGECLDMAIDAGAATTGQWTGAHATMVHGSAKPCEMDGGEGFPLSYPYGITVNERGERFLDEGENHRMYTYAKMGERLLEQPGARAFQVFDAQSTPLRAAPYLGRYTYDVPHYEVSDLAELPRDIGLDVDGLVRTVAEFNAAASDAHFDPGVLDGKRTTGLSPEKSNWAVPLVEPPFAVFPVECGLTFTYGGVLTDTDGRVVDTSGAPIPGLFAVGEMAGTFYFNYAAGSGLTKGAVIGRRAGMAASVWPGRHDPTSDDDKRRIGNGENRV